jgi:hypothetical protein
MEKNINMLPEINKISNKQIQEVCKCGKGEECCSFLAMGSGGFVCVKGTDMEPMIFQRRFLESMTAMGNNCSGPPDFKLNK